MLDTATTRDLFPGADGRTYLDAASLGLAPTPAVEAVRAVAGLVWRPRSGDAGSRHLELARLRAPAREAVARLLGAAPDDVALVENTAHGLGLAAAAIPMAPGDNVVLAQTDFIATAVPWATRRQREGIEVRFVPHRGGRVEVEDVAARMDERTRAVCLSSVQWTSGHRLDLAALSAAVRERGAWLVVDGAQQVGAVRLDVRETPVDFLACSGHKWLNSPFGTGFLYVGPRAAAALPAPHPGYLAGAPPGGNWGAYFAHPDSGPGDALSFPDAGRAWETGGTPNHAGAVGLAAAVKVVHDLGPAAVEEHVLELGGLLMERLGRLEVELVTPAEPERRAGIVTFRVPGDAEAQRAMWATLQSRQVHLSLRYAGGVGGLRASLHVYNDADDVDCLARELGSLL